LVFHYHNAAKPYPDLCDESHVSLCENAFSIINKEGFIKKTEKFEFIIDEIQIQTGKKITFRIGASSSS
jgi:hypothetical protein